MGLGTCLSAGTTITSIEKYAINDVKILLPWLAIEGSHNTDGTGMPRKVQLSGASSHTMLGGLGFGSGDPAGISWLVTG